MPRFKNCIGAIDGVHIQVSISPCDQIPYIGRKRIPTQNVMDVCNFDMQYTFACAWWECSAYDSRVFLTALRDPQSKFSKPPNGVKNQPVTKKYLIMHILHSRASLSALLGYGKRWSILRDMPILKEYLDEVIQKAMEITNKTHETSLKRFDEEEPEIHESAKQLAPWDENELMLNLNELIQKVNQII
ncbi:hypothetical protein Dsin_006773 [Dipteronia sinensis]|uniref:DDE Tnp4 domain-containing protein n=1 Tax=Dipteronia sinensis TaxID=43782 RepID=A0AAE0EFX9_9ROSI|nr:hypothetical protein Dsin_006773 [Dipteronia sinensis]